ncbi:MAG: hypothetical protein EOO10_00555 [Chitinophagaceae bacterium]|nr:MAG: hypothetical protein EOO10_00555 [Chitinophagaceae bacterium]
MRKTLLSFLLINVGLVVTLQSCRGDENITEPPVIADQSFVEEFDTLANAVAKGWVITNVSDPKGTGVWRQGGGTTAWFPPFSNKGSFAGFIGTDYTSTSAASGIISNWLISPLITMQNGDKISFYTRAYQFPVFDPSGVPTGDSTDYGNRLQVLINTANEGTAVGSGNTRGSFQPALDINHTYILSTLDPVNFSPYAFPSQWTRFVVTVSGLNQPKKGRFAFRYYIETGGSNAYGSGVAIDKVTYTSVNHK